ncbi:3-deoxy-7-phosphoheptulonate synthase [Clostridium sp.]|uniref:3-deoxy-7-phosphoheptulonate synthase n=1 Tax=Clostridium sp. TaxID=1506 RepID=UPI002FCA5859
MERLLVDNNSGPKITINIKGITIGQGESVFISGPCSVEDYDKMMAIGHDLKKIGIHVLRGGAFKPRTSPYDFQGLKMEGVHILHEVGKRYDMPIVTEIMDARDIEQCIPYIDIVQIGSRNMYNYTLLKELGKYDVPVILKRGMSATLSEWLYAAEYIMSGGNSKVILCERGIRTFETYTRNTLDLNSVAVIKQNYRLPIIVDPSHGTGKRELVEAMSMGAIACGADGLMIESHITPDNAISDARQTINMDTLERIVNKSKIIREII